MIRILLPFYLLAIQACPLLGAYGELELRFADASDPDKLVAVRLHILNAKGQPVKVKGVPAWGDHMNVQGSVILKLAPDSYRFTAERGPEYRDVRGTFEIESLATDNKTFTMERFVDMRKLNWWSGDLLTYRKAKELVPAMLADDLQVACNFQDEADDGDSAELPPAFPGVIVRSNQLLKSDGGRIAFLELSGEALPESRFRPEAHSGEMIVAARQGGVRHITAIDAAAWDLPMWLASRRLDSLMVLGPSLLRDKVDPPRKGWRPHDERRFPGAPGIGQWSEAIYFDVLNSGIRIPPVAGSGSGINSNPVGYNRVYAYAPGEFSSDAWWDAIKAGRVIVTNGPLMIPTVNGERPGHVFRAPAGQTLSLHPSLTLYTRDQIDYLEFIKDGRIVQSVPLERWRADNGQLPPIPFERSGWLMIRAVTANTDTYRAVMTGPYYVQIGDAPAVHKASCQFFADWCLARGKQVSSPDSTDRDTQRYHRAANTYWQQQLEIAE